MLSPVRLRTFSQQITTLQHHFISQSCSVPSHLPESHADDQLRVMDLTIIYLNYLSEYALITLLRAGTHRVAKM